MNNKFCARLACVAGLLISASVFAQPAVQCNSVAIAPGASGSVVCDYLGTGSGVVGGQFNIGIGNADVTIDSTACASGFTCPGTATDPFTVAFLNTSLMEVQDTTAAVTVNVTLSGTAVPGTMYPVTVSMESYGDAGGGMVAANGTMNGNITAQAGPGPGVLNVQPAMLPLTNAVNAAPTQGTITISNDGMAGDGTITPTCALMNQTGTATISITGTPGALAPGASTTVAANCSGTAAGSATADYMCTATSTMGTPTVTNDTTAITCTVAAGTPVPNPAGGSNVTVNVGPVVRGNAGTGTLTFTETANQGGSYDVSCTLDNNGGGAYAITSATSATGVSASSPFALTFSGQSTAADPQPAGAATCTYSNGATGTVSITLGIAIVPEIVPTLSQWGLIILTLILVGFGAIQMRRRASL